MRPYKTNKGKYWRNPKAYPVSSYKKSYEPPYLEEHRVLNLVHFLGVPPKVLKGSGGEHVWTVIGDDKDCSTVPFPHSSSTNNHFTGGILVDGPHSKTACA